MHHVKRSLLLTIAFTAGLASAANAQTLRFQFNEKDKLFYSIEQKTKSTAGLMGVDIVSVMNADMSMYWEVLKVESNGSAQVKMKFTHSKMKLDSVIGVVEVDSKNKDAPNDPAGRMLAQMNSAFAAMEITATMLPTGELKDVKVSEGTAKALRAIPSADKFGDLGHPDNFKDMLSSLVFPAQAVVKGKSWTHKSEGKFPEGKVITEQVYTLEETIDRDGARLEKISLKPKIKVEADANAAIKVKSVDAFGHALFDNKAGRFVESVMQQTKRGQIDVMGIQLDNTSVQTTTIRLGKQSADEKIAAAKNVDAVKIDESEYVEKVVATEQLETLPGVARSFTVERSFEPSVTLTGKASPSDELNAKVAAASGVSIGKRTLVKESVTLDGKALTKVNVVWVERYRRGSALAADGSTVSFLVKVGLRFKLEQAK